MARGLGPDDRVKRIGVTWVLSVAAGSQPTGSTVKAAAAKADAAASGDVAPVGSPAVNTREVLKVLGVGALAVTGAAGLAYLLSRPDRRERLALEQEVREQRAALEREAHARQQLENFIEEKVESAAARHFGDLRGRVEAGERGRDLRSRSHEQERDNKAAEAERQRVERAAAAEGERDRKAADAAAQRDRRSAAVEASRAGSAASAWAQQQREFQQRADAQRAAFDAEIQGLKDQLTALLRPPTPPPSRGTVPGDVTDRLRKLYDDD